MTHAAVPLAAGLGLGRAVISRKLLYAGIVASMLPDIDVYVRYILLAVQHRGITHSFAFAFVLGLLAWAFAPALEARRRTAFVFVSLTTASHGLLDAFTNGGGGIALLWPFTHERYFMPWRVIEVSPIGITRFFSSRGVHVLASEIVWVWSFAVLLGLTLYLVRKLR